MSNQDKKQVARSFAKAFAAALEDNLVSFTEREWLFEISDTAESNTQNSMVASLRLIAEGALNGELFVEFTESQVLAILSAVTRQPVQEIGEDQLAVLVKLMVSVAEKLAGTLAGEWGDIRFRVEQTAGLASTGMHVVRLAVNAVEAGSQVLLYFDEQLLDALLAKGRTQTQAKDHDWSVHPRNLRLVMDVELDVSLRFGQRKLQLREVLDLTSGSIVELDRMVDEPVELFLGDKLIARGEAVVVDGNYGLRVTEIPQPVSQFLN